MWKSDPFKAKWTIIAKADSTIRDAVGKQRTSLLAFLTLVCPKIGIINTEDYFWKMKWALQGTGAGTQVLNQTFLPGLGNFSTDVLYTNMTAKDIIQVCAQVGYISQMMCNKLAGNSVQPDGVFNKKSDISAKLNGVVPSHATAANDFV